MGSTVGRPALLARAAFVAFLAPAWPAILFAGQTAPPAGAPSTVVMPAAATPPAAAQAAAAASAVAPSAVTADPISLLEEAAKAWQARDLARWTALWDEGIRAEEERFVRESFAADQTTLEWLRRDATRADSTRFSADGQVFTAQEPNGRLTYWRLTAEKRPFGWAFTGRSDTSVVDGFVHVSLAGRAWRANGLTLRLPDFELRMQDGTLFANPEPLGPTVLVFVGRGSIRVSPAPTAERAQLKRFSGKETLEAEVRWAFVRLHPSRFDTLLEGGALEPDPGAALRLEEARRVFNERSGRSFVLDAPLPGAPWWLLPGQDDVVVDFPWRRGRVLTFALSGNEAEDLNLFDRDRQLQICAYPSQARASQPFTVAQSPEVLDQDLAVRFEPDRRELTGVHRLRLRSATSTTLRLRLNDDFRVSSVTSGDGTELLFFRVRGQGSLVVSLGGIEDRDKPFTVITHYAGRHDPVPVDQELLQVARVHGDFSPGPLVEPPPIVYSNRTAWYPRPAEETFSPLTAAFDTPEGWLAVTGGELRSLRTAAHRTHAEYRLAQPGKFVTAIVGRLSEVGLRQTGEISLRAFSTVRSHSLGVSELRAAEQILAFYAQLFGPCPYPSLSLVAVEAKVPGGHSPPGLIYVQERPAALRAEAMGEDPANFADLDDFFIAHELAHQWFGQSTAPVGYRERWLSEAWAQYAAALWVQHRQGESAFRDMLERMADWAARDDAVGPIHLGQRLGVLERDARLYRAVVYDKGACVLHMLRAILGDEAFFAGTRSYLERHRFGKVTTSDLRLALEQASGRSLRPYFERWIYATGLPQVTWSAHTREVAGGFETTLAMHAHDTPGPLPVEVTIESSAGRERRRVVLEPPGGSWTFTTKQQPRSIDLNDDRSLLARFERGKVTPEAIGAQREPPTAADQR